MSEPKNNRLISLVKVGKKGPVRQDLERGADPNVKDDGGRTPLHWAAQQGLLDIVRLLLRFGARVNLRDSLGFTPLAVAAGEGYESLVRQFVAAGASPDLRIHSNEGGTALHLACSWGRSRVVRILVECSEANVNLRDRTGKTPLGYALEAGDTESIALLRERGAYM